MSHNFDLAGSLFKYAYGLSSEEQLVFCEARLDVEGRKSRDKYFTARWLSYEIDHLRRLIAAGRGKPSWSKSLYSGAPVLLSKLKPVDTFCGNVITVPISFKER